MHVNIFSGFGKYITFLFNELCDISLTGWCLCFIYYHPVSIVVTLNTYYNLFATQPLDLKNCSLSVHIFTLNEDGPSTLSLEEDEELSAANHWLLPTGNNKMFSYLFIFKPTMKKAN